MCRATHINECSFFMATRHMGNCHTSLFSAICLVSISTPFLRETAPRCAKCMRILCGFSLIYHAWQCICSTSETALPIAGMLLYRLINAIQRHVLMLFLLWFSDHRCVVVYYPHWNSPLESLLNTTSFETRFKCIIFTRNEPEVKIDIRLPMENIYGTA